MSVRPGGMGECRQPPPRTNPFLRSENLQDFLNRFPERDDYGIRHQLQFVGKQLSRETH
ncbi:MAG: hypothetical protein ACOYXR_11070 [Nitrospirota bacterium]